MGKKLNSDPRLPLGWTVNWSVPHIRLGTGRLIKGWAGILEMCVEAGLDPKLIQFIRSGLTKDGWLSSDLLPVDWAYKKYRHTITGIPKDALILCTSDGKKYRSVKKALKDHQSLTVAETDNLSEWFRKTRADFSSISADEANCIQWSTETSGVPQGWKYKCYSSFAKRQNKTILVHLYLTPGGKVIRGHRLLSEYLVQNGLHTQLFDQFALLKKPRVTETSRKNSVPRAPKSKNVAAAVQADESMLRWRDFDHSLLKDWKFKMLFLGSTAPVSIHYMSPCGRVFKSRGPAIRFLLEERNLSYGQATYLKNIMKLRQTNVCQLKKNDAYLKTVPTSQNLLIFLKQRYLNSGEEEKEDSMFPPNWRKKIINGVEYIRNPEGNVFNSRKLATDHMRASPDYSQTEVLRMAMDDPDSESELSDEEDGAAPFTAATVKLEAQEDSSVQDQSHIELWELRLQRIKRTEERDKEIKDDIEEELDEGIGRISEPGDLIDDSEHIIASGRRRSDSGQGASDITSESSGAARSTRTCSPVSPDVVVYEGSDELLNDDISLEYDMEETLIYAGGKHKLSDLTYGDDMECYSDIADAAEGEGEDEDSHNSSLEAAGFHDFLRRNTFN